MNENETRLKALQIALELEDKKAINNKTWDETLAIAQMFAIFIEEGDVADALAALDDIAPADETPVAHGVTVDEDEDAPDGKRHFKALKANVPATKES